MEAMEPESALVQVLKMGWGLEWLAGWEESMRFLRSREFDTISCRDDYRMSRQIASRMNAKTQEHRRSGR